MSGRARRGFTLIEVMVAIGIIALIGVLIYAAFDGMNRSRRNMIDVSGRYQHGRQAIERMSRELSSAFISAHKNFLQLQNVRETAFIGIDDRPDRVDFNAFAHQRLQSDTHESDQLELSYFVARNRETGTMDLVRRSSRVLDHDPQRGGVVEAMVENVADFQLWYLDPLTNEWLETWDSLQPTAQLGRLPAQVWITLVLAGGPGGQQIRFETKVPIAMQLPLTFGTD